MAKKMNSSSRDIRTWSLNSLRQLFSQQGGGTAVAFAAAAPVLLAAAGIASDISIATMKKSELQSLADLAAIAAANELVIGNTAQDVVLATATAFVDASATGASRSIAKSADVAQSKAAVTVTLTESWAPMFAHFVGFEVTPITVDATASLAGQANICVLALEPAAPHAIRMDKNAKMDAKKCGVYSNSKNSQGLRLDDASSISAALICSAGGVKAKSSASSPAPSLDCPVVEDPLASRVAPPVEACTQTGLWLSTGQHTLVPGTYCNGIRISGDAKVTFEPGTFVITNGAFRIEGDARVIGDNAGFYLTGDATVLSFDGNATISLQGAKDGPLAGLLFYEDRDSIEDRIHRIRTANANDMTGTFYLPRGRLRIDPNGVVGEDSAYTAIVVRMLELSEGPTLVLNSDYTATDVPVPLGVRSNTTVVLSE